MLPDEKRNEVASFLRRCLGEYSCCGDMPCLEKAVCCETVFIGVDDDGLSCRVMRDWSKDGARKVVALRIGLVQEVAPSLYMACGRAALLCGRDVRISALCRQCVDGCWYLLHCHMSVPFATDMRNDIQ